MFLSNIAASLGFYLVGLMLSLLKPEDRLTRRASLTLLAWASYTLYISLEPVGQLFTFWERVILYSINLVYPLQFALSYHFYYRFPASAPRGRLWTSLGYLLYLWACPERLYVFYRGEEKHDLTLGYSSGGQSHDLRITEESELLRLMQRQRRSQDFPLPPNSGLPEAETAWLTQLGVKLIVPMSGADGRMAGLLLHRGFYFLAHKPRKLGHRIQLFDLLDQVEQDLLLAVVR